MLKLLVVEDHALVREGLVRLLAQMERGVEVLESADFESALNVLDNEGEFDLVLLDLALPGIDGFEVLFRIKNDPALSSIPVVILSNLGQKEDIERGMKLGATDYLIKAHLTPSEIIGKVRAVLKV